VADLLLQVGISWLYPANGKVKRGLAETTERLQRILVRPTPKAGSERAQAASGCPEPEQDAAAGLPNLNVT
jgi:hypothetical protein